MVLGRKRSHRGRKGSEFQAIVRNGSKRASLRWCSQGLAKGSAESTGACQPMLIIGAQRALCLFQVRGLQARSLMLMRSTLRWGQLVIQNEQWESESAQERMGVLVQLVLHK